MWLLSIKSRQLQWFEGKTIPPYAILSHRWGDDEVTFQALQNGSSVRHKGYSKIDGFCRQVEQDGLSVRHVWVDTCCIDKSNSSELSEAINSMYQWYERAVVCYAYLSDVSHTDLATFEQSTWFFRGWTLQELLAPQEVIFFNDDWLELGSKRTLHEAITRITGIPRDALAHFDPRAKDYSVADRMSWAAWRQTKREEDVAYSLLGIFGVNMPLIYGEGEQAYLRLQEEILKSTEDLSIFAWAGTLNPSTDIREASHKRFGLFAASPASFYNRNKRFTSITQNRGYFDVPMKEVESSLSGSGLTLTVFLVPYFLNVYMVPLSYVDHGKNSESFKIWDGTFAAMFVERNQYTATYRRVMFNNQILMVGIWRSHYDDCMQNGRIVLQRYPLDNVVEPESTCYGFRIQSIDPKVPKLLSAKAKGSQSIVEIFKRKQEDSSLSLIPGTAGVAGIIRFNSAKTSPVYIHFGFTFDFSPFCLMSRPLQSQPQVNDISDHVISTRGLGCENCQVASNADIMKLVSVIQSTPTQKYTLKEDNIELHLMTARTWTRLDFVCGEVVISMQPTGGWVSYWYNVSISELQIPISASSQSIRSRFLSKNHIWKSEAWGHAWDRDELSEYDQLKPG